MAYVDPHDGTSDAVAAADRTASVLRRAGHPEEADEIPELAHCGEVGIALSNGIFYLDRCGLLTGNLEDTEPGFDAATAKDDGFASAVSAARRIIARIKHK